MTFTTYPREEGDTNITAYLLIIFHLKSLTLKLNIKLNINLKSLTEIINYRGREGIQWRKLFADLTLYTYNYIKIKVKSNMENLKQDETSEPVYHSGCINSGEELFQITLKAK